MDRHGVAVRDTDANNMRLTFPLDAGLLWMPVKYSCRVCALESRFFNNSTKERYNAKSICPSETGVERAFLQKCSVV